MTPADRRALVGVAYVFAAITAAAVLLALCTAGCALHHDHSVMPVPADWTLPPAYAQCQADHQVTWPDRRVTIVVRCSSGSLYLDKTTKALVDIDTLDFRTGKQ